MFDKKFLKENPIFWSRLGGEWYPPLYDPEGKPYYGNTEEDIHTYQRYHREFAAAGVHVHSIVLDRGWPSEGVYDYRVCDLQLKQLFTQSGMTDEQRAVFYNTLSLIAGNLQHICDEGLEDTDE